MTRRTKEENASLFAGLLKMGFTEDEARKETTPRHPLKEYTFDELQAEPDAGWLAGDAEHPILLADAIWMDYGLQKSGKTYRALELAFCVAFGIEYYGYDVRQGNVAYVIAEGGIKRIFKRVRALCSKYRAELKTQGYATVKQVIDSGKFNLIGSPVNIADTKGASGIDDLLAQLRHRPYVAVWLDTWARMLAVAGGHVSDAETVPQALAGCDRIRDHLDHCTVVIVAHVGTAAAAQHRPKGLNETTGNIDGATECAKEGDGNGAVFAFTSAFQRHGAEGFVQTFKQIDMKPDRVFVAEGAGSEFGYNEADLTDADRQMLAVLRGMPELTTADDWRDAVKAAGLLSGKAGTARKAWKRAKEHLLTIGAIEIEGGAVKARHAADDPAG
jgi:hypothetical protein